MPERVTLFGAHLGLEGALAHAHLDARGHHIAWGKFFTSHNVLQVRGSRERRYVSFGAVALGVLLRLRHVGISLTAPFTLSGASSTRGRCSSDDVIRFNDTLFSKMGAANGGVGESFTLDQCFYQAWQDSAQ